MFQVLLNPGIHGPPGQGTDRSESVRDFVGPGPVLPRFGNFSRPGTTRRFPNFAGPSPVLGRFGPWIPD